MFELKCWTRTPILAANSSTAALRSASDFTDPKSSGSRLPSADMFGPWIRAIRHVRASGPRSSDIVAPLLVSVVMDPNKRPCYTGSQRPAYLTICIFDRTVKTLQTGAHGHPGGFVPSQTSG